MKKRTQIDKIKHHLKHIGAINQADCFTGYRIMRLSAIIHTLRDEGWNIKSIQKKNPNTGSHYIDYVLVKEEEKQETLSGGLFETKKPTNYDGGF
tara:strand:+ start:448 stop:732 length:285 start_codon:yes stop_codon:yes gene_type:complete